MALADSATKTAVSLIRKYGKTVLITHVTAQGAYDSSTGKTAAPTTTQTTTKAIVKDVDQRTYGQTVNLLVKVGDKIIELAASNIDALSISDTFTIDGITYMVVPVREGGLEIQTIFVSETPVLYKVHGRRT